MATEGMQRLHTRMLLQGMASGATLHCLELGGLGNSSHGDAVAPEGLKKAKDGHEGVICPSLCLCPRYNLSPTVPKPGHSALFKSLLPL